MSVTNVKWMKNSTSAVQHNENELDGHQQETLEIEFSISVCIKDTDDAGNQRVVEQLR